MEEKRKTMERKKKKEKLTRELKEAKPEKSAKGIREMGKKEKEYCKKMFL